MLLQALSQRSVAKVCGKRIPESSCISCSRVPEFIIVSTSMLFSLKRTSFTRSSFAMFFM